MNLVMWLFNKRFYWHMRKKFKNFGFIYNKYKYIVISWSVQLSKYIEVLYRISKRSVEKLLVSILCVYILESIDKLIFGSPEGYFKTLHDIGVNQTTLYFSISGIVATFATIFFATVSIVASTSYKDFSYEIRRLIWLDKDISFYFDYLLSLILFSFVLAITNSTVHMTGSIIFYITAILCVLGVYSLAYISIKLFDLFSPVNLIQYYVVPELEVSVGKVTVDNYQWNIPEVQALHRRNALKCFSLIDEVAIRCFSGKGDKVSDSEFIDFIQRFLLLLCYYTNMKTKIPFGSQWHARFYKHKKWFTADSASIEVALQTQTNLFPDTEIDDYWFEKKVILLIKRMLDADLEARNLNVKITIIEYFDKAIESLCGRGEAVVVTLLLDEIIPAFNKCIDKLDTSIDDCNDIQIDEKIVSPLALADGVTRLSVTAVLLTAKWIENLSMTQFTKQLDSLNWDDIENIYSLKMPYGIINVVVDLREKILNERKIERKNVTPKWYINQVVSIGFVKYLKTIPDISTMFLNLVVANIESYQNKSLICNQIIDRAIELIEKCSLLISALSKQQDDALEFNITYKDQAPILDIDLCRKALATSRKKIVKYFASLSVASVTFPDHVRVPDFMGRSYWFVSIECFHALINNDTELFSKIFPAFFANAFLIYDKFSKKASDPYWVARNASILISIYALSGYALILRDLIGSKCWYTVNDVWRKYKSGCGENFTSAIFASSSVVSLSREAGLFSNSDHVLLMWQGQFRRLLIDNNVIEARDLLRGRRSDDRNSGFDSNLLQIIHETVSDISWFYEPELLFIYYYLEKELVNNNFNISGSKYGSLVQQARRLEQNDGD